MQDSQLEEYTPKRNMPLIWLIILVIGMLFAFFVLSATTSSGLSSAGSGNVDTTMPQSMPGMNH